MKQLFAEIYDFIRMRGPGWSGFGKGYFWGIVLGALLVSLINFIFEVKHCDQEKMIEIKSKKCDCEKHSSSLSKECEKNCAFQKTCAKILSKP
ncbi:hypothetical protein [Parvibium lacunae]|uniref:Uncharacterized protein n=1 Tax=Parvibium lacunae TaxID=1888893 RepID=A0A368KZK0_9BURK|nr:hypothetical protein [Parvibium lacunae]RCS56740.1 hypothetical protein DU000_10335 [Parvibium lacunae]